MVASEHDLGVVDDIQREDDGTHRGITNLGVAVILKCHCQCLLTFKIVHVSRYRDEGIKAKNIPVMQKITRTQSRAPTKGRYSDDNVI